MSGSSGVWPRSPTARCGSPGFVTNSRAPDVAEPARSIEGVLALAQSGHAASRQALLACVVFSVVDRKSPLLQDLCREAEQQALLRLEAFCSPHPVQTRSSQLVTTNAP